MEIADKRPRKMLITEVIPKAQMQPIEPARLTMSGYNLYTNFNPLDSGLGTSGLRGICIYTDERLQCCEVTFPDSQFSEQLWVKLKLQGGDSLLMGCLYRSPSSGEDSVHHFKQLLQLVMAEHPSHLLLAGDFNLGDIDWQNHLSQAPPSHCSHAFLEVIDDHFLHQHVTFPTRFRQGHTPRVLDLIFTNEEGMVQNLHSAPGLGKSDHVILKFSLVGYSSQAPSASLKLALSRGNYAQLTELARQMSWAIPTDSSIDMQFKAFRTMLEHICQQCIPLQRPQNRKRNIFMTREAMLLKKKKRQLWHKYVRSRDALDHARFVRARNELRGLTRRLRKEFEAGLARGMKNDTKPFWRYTNSRLKTKSRVEDLVRPDGSTASTDQEKAQTLADFFSSVFCQDEDGTYIPTLNANYEGPLLEDVEITASLVEIKLKKI